MKKFLAIGLLLLPTVLQGVERAEYKTLFLIQWVYNCSQQMSPHYQMTYGLPSPIALQEAIKACSCVIDKFREDFSYEAITGLPAEERAQFGEGYSAQCLGYTTGT